MQGSATSPGWYIVRTKQHKERFVKEQASLIADDVYLPLFRKRTRYLKKITARIEALFPCCIFAYFDLTKAYYKLRHSPGVTDIICIGSEPCEVDDSIISKLKNRETNGLIEIVSPRLQTGQRVNILQPPFAGIEAVFERYLSGAERVAVLLNAVSAGTVRAIVSARAVIPQSFTC
jgi:transcriptional antiterminator RfaH